MKKGTFKVVRVDGSVENYNQKPTLDLIYEKLGVDCIDTVTITRDRWGKASEIMLVDDNGMIDNKPVNDKATAIMQALHKDGFYPYSIHGDVAICHDADFGEDI